MNKIIDALKLAENTLRDIIRVYKFETGTPVTALAAIREALAEQEKQGPVISDVFFICNAYESGFGHGANNDGLNDGSIFANKQQGEAYEFGYAEGLKRSKREPVKQEPVAHYKDAPHTIYLQTGCDDPEDCECSFNEWGDTTWCADQIHDTDIPYIRADYAAPVDAKAIRAEALEEAAKLCEQGTGDAVQTDVLKALWKERERIAEVIRGLK